MTAAAVVRATGLSLPAVNHATEALQRLNVVRELSGKRRNRVFAYGAYLDALEEA
ncbi:MAG TPA: hypothetical protein VEI02_07250 [Planctomycetota bacterium]|nr:hypothetical protein [Planctomycetota bacterium]